MRRLVLPVCLLILASGCGKSAKTANQAANGGGDTRPALTKESSMLDIAKDFLQGSSYSDVKIVSKEEKPATLHKKPAVALHLQWSAKGEAERNDLFLIQDQKVQDFTPYDTAKSMEENIAAAVQKLEKP